MYGQNTKCKSCLGTWLHPQHGLLSVWNTARLTLFLYFFHTGSWCFFSHFIFFFWVVKYQHDYKYQRNTKSHTQRNSTHFSSGPFSSSHSFNSGPNQPHRQPLSLDSSLPSYFSFLLKYANTYIHFNFTSFIKQQSKNVLLLLQLCLGIFLYHKIHPL